MDLENERGFGIFKVDKKGYLNTLVIIFKVGKWFRMEDPAKYLKQGKK